MWKLAPESTIQSLVLSICRAGLAHIAMTGLGEVSVAGPENFEMGLRNVLMEDAPSRYGSRSALVW